VNATFRPLLDPRTNAAARLIRPILSGLLAVVAINAFAGGVYGFQGAEGVPAEWLEGTPFKTYFFPSLVLFAVVGGFALVATVGVLARRPWGRVSALGSGFVLATWMTVQLWMIGYVSWMQPCFVVIAVLVLVLAWALPRPATATAAGSRAQER